MEDNQVQAANKTGLLKCQRPTNIHLIYKSHIQNEDNGSPCHSIFLIYTSCCGLQPDIAGICCLTKSQYNRQKTITKIEGKHFKTRIHTFILWLYKINNVHETF